MLDLTPLLRIYARARLRRLAGQDAAATQQRQLLRLVRRARATRFGVDHGFDRIDGVAAYQERVPIRRYEDFWNDYWKDAFPTLTDRTWPGTIPYIALSSGTTTGTTKYLPVSPEMVAANRRAVLDLLSHHLAHRPLSRVLAGKSFMLGGSADLSELAPGVRGGDLTGIAANEIPAWARRLYFPPPNLARIADWEEKMAVLGRRSLDAGIRTIGGTASWLLLFLDQLVAAHPAAGGRLAPLYPELELVVHGGVNFAPYRARFERLLEGSRAELREVYPASEGFVAVADRGTGEGLRLLIDNGLFFEFVPVEDLAAPNPARRWIATVEPDVNYAIVVSSCAGLWSYRLGDTVRFVDREPPRLLVTGRTSYSLSAFGEHLIGEEIEQAVAAAAAAIERTVADYSVGPIHPDEPNRRGGHLYVVEFAEGVPEAPRLAAFATAVDDRLSALNQDYKDHRAAGFGMDPPRVQPVAPGTFAAWMRQRGKLGGQNKVPRVINDPELFRSLREVAEPRRGT